jgi:hypothetical protein
MKTTYELLEAYLNSDGEQKDLNIQDYNLNGTLLTIEYSVKRDDITELDIKYGTTHYNKEAEVHILDYITFVSQINIIK